MLDFFGSIVSLARWPRKNLRPNNQARLHYLTRIWPEDIQEHLIRLMQEGAGVHIQPGP
jgi:hypothetical protein